MINYIATWNENSEWLFFMERKCEMKNIWLTVIFVHAICIGLSLLIGLFYAVKDSGIKVIEVDSNEC